jgi:hypothetical protein
VWDGYCLTPLPDPGDGRQSIDTVLEPCSGDDLQKWNAVPHTGAYGLSNIEER